MDLQDVYKFLGIIVFICWLGVMLLFVLKETTYLFERIENRYLSIKNKDIFVIFPNKEWRKFIKKNKIYTLKNKFSFINLKINQLYKHGLLVEEDIKRINGELLLLVGLMLNTKGGKREVLEIYKSIREFEERIDNYEFLRGYHEQIKREIEEIEKIMPYAPLYDKTVDENDLKEIMEELWRKHPEKKNAGFFKLVQRIVNLNNKLDLNQENKKNLHILTSKAYKILTEKRREWMDVSEKEDIARTERIKEKIKTSRQNY